MIFSPDPPKDQNGNVRYTDKKSFDALCKAQADALAQFKKDNEMTLADAATLKATIQNRMASGEILSHIAKDEGIRLDEAQKLLTSEKYQPFKETP